MILEVMEFRIAKITLYVLIFTLSCVGNSLVAIVIVGAKDMRTPPNFLILSLALCDFITPALSIPFDLALEENKYIWPFGKAMCKVLWPFQTACSTSSSLTLALISLERYNTLSKPFGRRVTNHQVLLFVLAIHAFSISLCIPYFLVLKYNGNESSCDEVWPGVGYRQAYTIVLFLCGYAIPLITMSISYLLIYRSLRSNLLRLTIQSRDRRQGRSQTVSKVSQLSTASRDNVEHKRKEQNIRLAKMFIIVVVVFAISMFPNQVLWLWVDFGNGEDNDYFNYISVVSRLCTYANSVLNPFIYALKSKEFRSGFARIGRASIHPLRKISSETRKFARKISRVSDNHSIPTQCPASVPMRSLACSIPTMQTCSVHTADRKDKQAQAQAQAQEIDFDKPPGNSCKAEDMWKLIHDTSFQETILSPTLCRLLGDLRETDC